MIAQDRTIVLAAVDPDWTKRPEPTAIRQSLRALTSTPTREA